jgi:hypothetical protein
MAGGGNNNNGYGGNDAALDTLPEPREMGKLVLHTAVIQTARWNPLLSTTYVVGILLLLIVGIAFCIMESIDLQSEYKATNQYSRADQMYQHTRRFLGWSCDNC